MKLVSVVFTITLMCNVLNSSVIAFLPPPIVSTQQNGITSSSPNTMSSFLETAIRVQLQSNKKYNRVMELSIFGGGKNKKIVDDDENIGKQISSGRRKQLGIADNEDEYDLEVALNNNTDPLITKIIAGSLILAITAGLIFGLVIPATTDYGEGVCNTILTGGRC